jgi:hypothetical protein
VTPRPSPAAVHSGPGRPIAGLLASAACAFACSKPAPPAPADAGSAPSRAHASTDTADGSNPAAAASSDVGGVRSQGARTMPALTLLEPGRAPRQPLRYTWRVDQPEQLTMDLRTTATTNEANVQAPRIPLPPVRIVMAIDPRSVTSEGDLRYAWRVTSTAVGNDAGAPDPVVEGMQAEVATVAALSGTGVVTSRGLTREVNLDRASLSGASAARDASENGGQPATGKMVDQVLQTLRDVAAPFPEEDVGVGARWQKLSDVASSDAAVTQTETFTLVEIAPSRGTLHDVLVQTAPSQPLLAEGMPAGAQARMESMLVSADAKTTFDFSRLVPQTRIETTTTMVLSGHAPGDSMRRVGMVLRVEILLSGATR